MMSGGLIFVFFMVIWIIYAVAKDYERQAKSINTEETEQIKNKKVGKKHV